MRVCGGPRVRDGRTIQRDRPGLGPHIPYAAAVAGQILERVQPIEVVDPQIRHRFGRGESDIYRDAPASIFVET